MKVIKAGCILVDIEHKKIALIYRENRKDYSFPKGHLEGNESLIECAIRETEEEIKRIPIILDNNPIVTETYFSSNNEDINVSYFLAKDGGKSENKSTDSHELIWTNIEDVEKMLTYQNSIKMWNNIKNKVNSLFD